MTAHPSQSAPGLANGTWANRNQSFEPWEASQSAPLSPTHILYRLIDEGTQNGHMPREKIHLPGDYATAGQSDEALHRVSQLEGTHARAIKLAFAADLEVNRT